MGALRLLGMSTRRGIAAASTMLAALPPQRRSCQSRPLCPSSLCRQHTALSTLTIALMAGPIGRQDGLSERRSGAAESTERAALARAQAAPLSLRRQHLMTATLVSATGWQAGAWPRRIGAARMLERAALQLQADVHERIGCH